MSSFLLNGEWAFPNPVSVHLRVVVNNLPSITPFTTDWVEWLPNASGNFSSKSAMEVIRDHREKVAWYNVVWFKGNISRKAVILCWFLKGSLRLRIGFINGVVLRMISASCVGMVLKEESTHFLNVDLEILFGMRF